MLSDVERCEPGHVGGDLVDGEPDVVQLLLLPLLAAAPLSLGQVGVAQGGRRVSLEFKKNQIKFFFGGGMRIGGVSQNWNLSYGMHRVPQKSVQSICGTLDLSQKINTRCFKHQQHFCPLKKLFFIYNCLGNGSVFGRKFTWLVSYCWVTLTTTWHLTLLVRGIWMWNCGFIAVVSENIKD